MKYTNFILFTLLLCSCAQKECTKVDRIVDSLINSVSIEGSVMSIYEKNMGTYFLYVISNSSGPVYDERGEIIVSKIRILKDKYVFYYFHNEKPISIGEEKLIELLQKDSANHKILWYYAVCEKSEKEVLVQADNIYVAAYEIPQIRDFSCSLTATLVPPIEVIVDYVTAVMNDSLGAIDIYMIANLYDRTSDVLTKKIYDINFVFIRCEDTFRCKVKKLPLNDILIEDTLWKKNTALVNKYALNVTVDNQQNMDNLVRSEQIKNLLNRSMFSVYKYDSCSIVKSDTIRMMIPQEVNVNIKDNHDCPTISLYQ